MSCEQSTHQNHEQQSRMPPLHQLSIQSHNITPNDDEQSAEYLRSIIHQQAKEISRLKQLLHANGLSSASLTADEQPPRPTITRKRSFSVASPQFEGEANVPLTKKQQLPTTSPTACNFSFSVPLQTSSPSPNDNPHEGLGALIDSMNDTFLVYNHDFTQVLYVAEKSYERIFGKGAAQRVRAQPSNWISAIHLDDLRTMVAKVLQANKAAAAEAMHASVSLNPEFMASAGHTNPVSPTISIPSVIPPLSRWRQVVEFDYRVTRPDGDVRYIRTMTRTLQKSPSARDPATECHIFISTDLTDMKSSVTPEPQFSPPVSILTLTPLQEQQKDAIIRSQPSNTIVMTLARDSQCLEYFVTSDNEERGGLVDPQMAGHFIYDCLRLDPVQALRIRTIVSRSADLLHTQTLEICSHKAALPQHYEIRTVPLSPNIILAIARSIPLESSYQRGMASMCHDMRTPLNGVIGMTSLLLHSPLTEEQREYMEIIRSSSMGLLKVIDTIMNDE